MKKIAFILFMLLPFFFFSCKEETANINNPSQPELSQLLDQDKDVQQIRKIMQEIVILIPYFTTPELKALYAQLDSCGPDVGHYQGTLEQVKACTSDLPKSDAFVKLIALDREKNELRTKITKRYPELNQPNQGMALYGPPAPNYLTRLDSVINLRNR